MIRSVLVAFLLVGLPTFPHAHAQQVDWPDPVAGDIVPYRTAGLSHGPLLGRITDSSVAIWVRTRKPTEVEVVYSQALPLTSDSAKVSFATKGTMIRLAVRQSRG